MRLLRRPQSAIGERTREKQARFRSNRSSCRQIFYFRNIIEQCIEYRHPLCVNFVDFQKAFDGIHRESLWAILRIPQTFVDVFRSLYLNSSCCVKTENGRTGFFEITTDVKQGWILSPILFNIALDLVMREAMKLNEAGIGWNNEGRLTDLDYADYIALPAKTDSKLHQATTNLNREAKKIGLRIGSEKSKGNAQIDIDVGAVRLEDVAKFTYLGSTVAYDGDDEIDVRTRIAKAASVFRMLQPMRRPISQTTSRCACTSQL
ncbi:hypothetical protein ANCDUO_00524 [Ancylostoma duodenale]|uniref:Reverse transcriptase domain-containing protein n=1 Tax=Ancylostoma duodenale TaxID=51022 RepID=A0A0C2HHL8_9BILA|nr:hypothetical protein ANCDUO_00524 [Ancylostoma duodenale]